MNTTPVAYCAATLCVEIDFTDEYGRTNFSALLSYQQVNNVVGIQDGGRIQDGIQNKNKFLKIYFASDLTDFFLKCFFIYVLFLEI